MKLNIPSCTPLHRLQSTYGSVIHYSVLFETEDRSSLCGQHTTAGTCNLRYLDTSTYAMTIADEHEHEPVCVAAKEPKLGMEAAGAEHPRRSCLLMPAVLYRLHL